MVPVIHGRHIILDIEIDDGDSDTRTIYNAGYGDR